KPDGPKPYGSSEATPVRSADCDFRARGICFAVLGFHRHAPADRSNLTSDRLVVVRGAHPAGSPHLHNLRNLRMTLKKRKRRRAWGKVRKRRSEVIRTGPPLPCAG